MTAGWAASEFIWKHEQDLGRCRSRVRTHQKEGLAQTIKGLGASLLLSPTKCSGHQAEGQMCEKRGFDAIIKSSCRSIFNPFKGFWIFFKFLELSITV